MVRKVLGVCLLAFGLVLLIQGVGFAQNVTAGDENNVDPGPKKLDLPADNDSLINEMGQDPDPIEEEEEEEEEEVEFFGEEVESESDSIVYVIDRSGSMGWGSVGFTNPSTGVSQVGDRMDRAKAELVSSINALPEDWEFSIASFECSHNTFSNVLVEANNANKSAATAWVMNLNAMGGTNTSGGTCLGLSIDRENMTVVLLSDGDPNCPFSPPNEIPAHFQAIMSCNQQGATINTFGIQASGQFRQFLEDLANATGGSYHDVNM